MHGVHPIINNNTKNWFTILLFNPKNEKNKKCEEKLIGMQQTK